MKTVHYKDKVMNTGLHIILAIMAIMITMIVTDFR